MILLSLLFIITLKLKSNYNRFTFTNNVSFRVGGPTRNRLVDGNGLERAVHEVDKPYREQGERVEQLAHEVAALSDDAQGHGELTQVELLA